MSNNAEMQNIRRRRFEIAQAAEMSINEDMNELVAYRVVSTRHMVNEQQRRNKFPSWYIHSRTIERHN